VVMLPLGLQQGRNTATRGHERFFAFLFSLRSCLALSHVKSSSAQTQQIVRILRKSEKMEERVKFLGIHTRLS
jgi:hypothetical protein